MRKIIPIISLMVFALFACDSGSNQTASGFCSPSCKAKNKDSVMSCKLSTPEMEQRKKTVLASLVNQVIEKRELDNGFAFKFPGSDKVIDELTEFIKTERECCDFFVFSISMSGDKSETWLELTGPEGSKDFISEEMGL